MAVCTKTFNRINKGNNLITLSNTNDFKAGDYIEIRQKNGSWDVSPISWADYSLGQMARVVSIIGNKLLIDSKLRIDYSLELEPEVRPVSPILNSGKFSLKRTNSMWLNDEIKNLFEFHLLE